MLGLWDVMSRDTMSLGRHEPRLTGEVLSLPLSSPRLAHRRRGQQDEQEETHLADEPMRQTELPSPGPIALGILEG